MNEAGPSIVLQMSDPGDVMFEYFNSVSERIRKNYHQGHHPLDVPDPENPESMFRYVGLSKISMVIFMIGMTVVLFSDEKTPGDGMLFMMVLITYQYACTLKQVAKKNHEEVKALKAELAELKANANSAN